MPSGYLVSTDTSPPSRSWSGPETDVVPHQVSAKPRMQISVRIRGIRVFPGPQRAWPVSSRHGKPCRMKVLFLQVAQRTSVIQTSKLKRWKLPRETQLKDVESFKAFLKPIDSMECYRDSFTHLLESSWCIAFETRGMSIPSQCHSMSTHQNDPRVLGRSRPQGSLVAPSELGQKLHGHRSSLRIHSRHRTVAAVAQHAWQHEMRTFHKAKEIANSLNLQVDGFSAFTELMSQIKCQLHACNALPRKSRMLFAAWKSKTQLWPVVFSKLCPELKSS